MHRYIVRAAVVLFLFSFLSSDLISQTSRILELENEKAYQLIERFVKKGRFNSINPTKLPYTHFDIYKELQKLDYDRLSNIEKEWFDQLKEEIRYSEKLEAKDYIIEPYVISGSEFNNSENKNSYRPTSDSKSVWPFTDLGLFADYKNFTINTNIRFDLYYEFGPFDFDPTNRLYMRNEDSYVGYSSEYFQGYVGRFENNWGIYDRKSTFMTGNAPTFDQINYTIGTRKFSFTTLHAFLDNISGNDEFEGNTINDPLSKRRYLSLKRVDWRVSDHLALSMKEGILYSGMNVNPEPKYMIPGFLYFLLEATNPRDQVENLLIGGNLWFNKNGFSVNLDMMIDDIIGNRKERGISEKNNFSLIVNSSYSFLNRPLAVNWDLEFITYQAYNTDQAEGRYLYLNKGIATQYNDYVFSELSLEYYADLKVKGLTIQPYVGVLKQGEQVINQTFQSSYPNGDEFEIVLTGTVESTTRLAFKTYYSPVNYFWAKFDMGYNIVDNFRNIEGMKSNRFVGMFEVGFKFNFKNL